MDGLSFGHRRLLFRFVACVHTSLCQERKNEERTKMVGVSVTRHEQGVRGTSNTTPHHQLSRAIRVVKTWCLFQALIWFPEHTTPCSPSVVDHARRTRHERQKEREGWVSDSKKNTQQKNATVTARIKQGDPATKVTTHLPPPLASPRLLLLLPTSPPRSVPYPNR